VQRGWQRANRRERQTSACLDLRVQVDGLLTGQDAQVFCQGRCAAPVLAECRGAVARKVEQSHQLAVRALPRMLYSDGP
jgi:hypothetical protein